MKHGGLLLPWKSANPLRPVLDHVFAGNIGVRDNRNVDYGPLAAAILAVCFHLALRHLPGCAHCVVLGNTAEAVVMAAHAVESIVQILILVNVRCNSDRFTHGKVLLLEIIILLVDGE